MTDFYLCSRMAELNSKMKPERIFHERGIGAYGKFQLYMPLYDFTKAQFLNETELPTEVFVRFSRALGQRGSAETYRDMRGMAVKFLTDDGEYDLICSNMPVFFVDNPEKIFNLYDAVRNEKGMLPDKEKFWKFMADNPETSHMLIWLFSDRGTIKSYRYMESYSVNTYIWRNREDKCFFVRYRWVPLNGIRSISAQEAEFLAGYAPDVMTKDLCDAVEEGHYPEYELMVQVVPQESVKNPETLLRKTLLWPEKKYPYLNIGRLTLNRLPENYFEEIDMAYISPSHIVPGIEIPEDSMTELMCFACDDEYRHRR